jgi:hypothetical protein
VEVAGRTGEVRVIALIVQLATLGPGLNAVGEDLTRRARGTEAGR